MNRTAALFFALGTFLAHCLAIHQDAAGVFGGPHENAHVAFRVARNLVHNTSLRWNPAFPAAEAYSSTLWVLVCSVGEYLFLPVTLFVQVLGIGFAMGTLFVIAEVNRGRLAGLVGSLLLVTSGSLASAATGGTELTLLTFLISFGYLLYERRAKRALGPILLLACLTRYEGVVFTTALFGLELIRRIRFGKGMASKPVLGAFLWPLAGALGAALVRAAVFGTPFSPSAAALADPAQWNPRLGLEYLSSFAIVQGAPLLFIFPLVGWLTRNPGEHGIRPLVLTFALALPAILTGGGDQPFWSALVPMLPFLALSIQESIELVVNSRRRIPTALTLGVLALGLGMSIFVSKLPGNIGPLRTRAMQVRWLTPPTALREAYGTALGRLGKSQEIHATERLRCTGLFLRDQVGPGSTLLTPWPGAVGYLAGITVFDLLGRATPPVGQTVPNAWFGRTRVDLLREFERRPDFILVSTTRSMTASTMYRVLARWIDVYDSEPPSIPRKQALLDFLQENYELIAVPVPVHSSEPTSSSRMPVQLLRRRDLNQAPTLRASVSDGRLSVGVRHAGAHQLADVRVRLEDAEGGRWFLRPNGTFVQREGVRARRDLLIYSTGAREMQLLSAELPAGIQAKSLEIALLSPGRDDSRLAETCSPVYIEL